jgi:hypothetical protein
MKSAKLANQVVVTNFEVTGLTLELNVLRFPAEDRMLKNAVSGAKSGKSLDDGVGPNVAIRADFHVFLDYGRRVDRHLWTRLQDFTDVSTRESCCESRKSCL